MKQLRQFSGQCGWQGKRPQIACQHNFLFVTLHSNVSSMASQSCDCHVHTYHWSPNCSPV